MRMKFNYTKFILHGGFASGNTDEDNHAFYEEILKDVPSGSKILLVPFAKDEDGGRIAHSLVKVSKEFDDVKRGRDIPIYVANREDFIDQIKGSDVIYFHGGVSLKLLEALRQYPELELAIQGKIVAGESAGANVWCKYFYSRKSDTVSEGLSILPIKLIPHYQEEFAHKLDNVVTDLELVCLPEYQHKVIIHDD
jgi:peptidase E